MKQVRKKIQSSIMKMESIIKDIMELKKIGVVQSSQRHGKM